MRLLTLLIALLIGTVYAQVTYPGCSNLSPSNFKLVKILSHKAYNLLHLPDGKFLFTSGHYGEGPIFLHDTKAGKTTQIPNSNAEWHGFGFSPDFATTGWMYFFESPNKETMRIFRQTYNQSTNTLSAKKLLMEWAGIKGADHCGGGFAIDKNGNVIVAAGDNSLHTDMWGSVNESSEKLNSLRTAANTNSLMGKVVRIKPIPFPDNQSPAPGVGSTYEIPPGNLADAYKVSMQWSAEDLKKIRPEIYTMGHRNPWTLSYDPVSNWILEGEVGNQARGDDAKKGSVGGDEFNLIKSAGNFGWPMFVGANRRNNFYDYSGNKMGPWFEVDAPRNTSKFNTGVQLLPPPKPALFFHTKKSQLYLIQKGDTVHYNDDSLWDPTPANNQQACVAGPRYHYRTDATDKARLPPHLHGAWLISDYYLQTIKALRFDGTGDNIEAVLPVVGGPASITQLSLDHQGVLYVATENQGLSRVEYTGTCHPEILSIASPNRTGNAYAPGSQLMTAKHFQHWRASNTISEVKIRDLQGKLLLHKQVAPGEAALQDFSARHQGLFLVETFSKAK